MGLEFKIETYDADRTKLLDFLRGLPEFLREEGGSFHLGTKPSDVLFTVSIEDDQFMFVSMLPRDRRTRCLV